MGVQNFKFGMSDFKPGVFACFAGMEAAQK